MDEYDKIRRNNEMMIQDRQARLILAHPEIGRIDREIAEISIAMAKRSIFSDASEVKETEDRLQDRIGELTDERRRLLTLAGYPENYLDPLYDCPACRDTGYVDNVPCECLKKRARKLLAARSGLDVSGKEVGFRHFRKDYYSTATYKKEGISPRRNMENILKVCRDYIENFDKDPGRNLLIQGNAGVGKTFLSQCVGLELLSRDREVLYLTSYRFFRLLEDDAFHRQEENENLSQEDIIGCDLLIIDDLGTELVNAFINSRLFLCINERILRKKSTIINTNLSLEKISRTYSERISSRIIESYTILSVFGEDIRLKKAFSSLDA